MCIFHVWVNGLKYQVAGHTPLGLFLEEGRKVREVTHISIPHFHFSSIPQKGIELSVLMSEVFAGWRRLQERLTDRLKCSSTLAVSILLGGSLVLL